MSLRIYNTLTRRKETFEPVEPGKVGMYLCGPTVYKPPHVGHMVGPVIFDAIKRWLTHRGYDVTWVTNITDVEDKLINKADELGVSVDSLVEKYEAEYKQALADLGVDTVDHYPRATDHIADIIKLCERLIANGKAYAADGNVWFDVSEDGDYGKLSGRRPDEAEATGREVVAEGKTDPRDFALWKTAKPGEPTWDSPWGPGRPGWHIECSAMSMKILGESFDIHGGGLDLMFPHHENELAQSEEATGKPFAKYWLHNGLTRMKTKASSGEWKDEKMSGSIGNVISAADFFEQHGPQTLRYVILATHYRSPIDFHDEVIEASKKGLANFARTAERLAGVEPGEVGGLAEAVAEAERKFAEAMDDDFNTAGAIAALHGLNSAIAKHADDAEAAAAAQTLGKLGALIGLDLLTPPQHDDLTGKLLDLFVELRLQRREAKDFATSDAIRDRLADLGVTLEDGKDGTTWHIG
ncbi:MAG: cysteine--tRNA ligase [Planctomycetota bacterium]